MINSLLEGASEMAPGSELNTIQDHPLLTRIPIEVWRLIFDSLGAEDRKMAVRVCRMWRDLNPRTIKIVTLVPTEKMGQLQTLFCRYTNLTCTHLPFSAVRAIENLQRLRSITLTGIYPQNIYRLSRFLQNCASANLVETLKLVKAACTPFVLPTREAYQLLITTGLRRFVRLSQLQLLPNYHIIEGLADLPLRKITICSMNEKDRNQILLLPELTALRVIDLSSSLSLAPFAAETSLKHLSIDTLPDDPVMFPYLASLTLRNAQLQKLMEQADCFPNSKIAIKSVSSFSLLPGKEKFRDFIKRHPESSEQIFRWAIEKSLSNFSRSEWKEIVSLILESGFNVNFSCKSTKAPYWFSLITYRGLEAVRYLIEKLDFSLKDSNQETALHYLVKADNIGFLGVEMIEIFLARGLSSETEDLHGNTPITLALERAHLIMADCLIQKSKQIRNTKILRGAINELARYSYLDVGHLHSIFLKLNEHSVDLNQLDSKNELSFFDQAIQCHSVECLKVACLFKIRPNVPDSFLTIFSKGNSRLSECFLAHYDPKFYDESLEDFFFSAVVFGEEEQVEQLLKQGVPIDCKTKEGLQGWQLALEYENYLVASFLYRTMKPHFKFSAEPSS